MTSFKTEQENFWAGSFGDEYNNRNSDQALIEGNFNFFSELFAKIDKVKFLIEFGANIGLNLIAIKKIVPDIDLAAIEINDQAVAALEKIDNLKIYHQSILDFKPERAYDCVLIKTVLIHINPEKLPQVYDLLYQSSKKYICLAEYYNPAPTVVEYRGNHNRLFKRDFAGEMLDKFPDLELIDYGFKYHRDKKYYDDLNWFILKKC
jgi:spore coat polysaccharide biosynthesis protein SpsF